MAELIVVGFKNDIYRASEVLNILKDLHENWAVDLHDAVAVFRDDKGKLRVDESYRLTTSEGAAVGGLLGGLLGAMLAAPFTAGAGAVAWFDRLDQSGGSAIQRERTVRFAGGMLGRERHICAFFDSIDEEYRVLRAFIEEGFDREERTVLTVDRSSFILIKSSREHGA